MKIKRINYIYEMDGDFFSLSDRLYRFIEELQDGLEEIVGFHIHHIWQTVVV